MIFLVDTSRAMFESQGEDEVTPFDMTIQVRLPRYCTHKIEGGCGGACLVSQHSGGRGWPGLYSEF